ncbi:MAG: MarR family transcriptional regulator, transcriptional regulator for hemolysin [Clostridiales bacterium]|jgi:DNA-binding MarR family transcriptional regulator|nr:MarR family transcriptional regulator, transcriptional regulator for hemolysin [Clostridiales bacterium]MDN5299780.1 MarR family transcriptional regulator, transcriptional regulator for hemolysin [Clostridiales bacterium]
MEFDLLNCIAFVTSSTSKNVTDDFNRRLEMHGSTRIQWIALYFLYVAEVPISQKQLAQQMNIQAPSAARLVDRMERDGLVDRIENPEDKRMKFIRLTETGKKVAVDLMPIGQYFSDLLLRDIPEHEIEIFLKVLNQLNQNIKE